MTDDTTPLDLGELERLAMKATPGEWFIHPKDPEAVNSRTEYRASRQS